MQQIIQIHKGARDQKLLIVYTGGTFGMKANAATQELEPYQLQNLTIDVPDLMFFKSNLYLVSSLYIKDSSEISVSDWQELAQLIQQNYQVFDGFVIVHGTDTMAYTASALSFLMLNCPKPIVFTGSQLPIGYPNSDAPQNLIQSISWIEKIMQQEKQSLSICICFGGLVLQANRSIKLHTKDFIAFGSFNAAIIYDFSNPMLAIALENEVRLAQNFSTKLSSKVSVLKYYPGFDSSLFSVFLDNTKYEVCIIESFGAGNLPYGQVLEQAIQYFIANGGFVINKTQCVQGAVNQNTYKTGNWLAKLGVLPAMDMTLEALLTKCMYLVANQKMNRFLEKLASEYTS